MRNNLRRYAISALAVGSIAGGAALALPGSAPAWRPVAHGLSERPELLLPAAVTPTHPVRVVSTALDSKGRPVVTVRTATDHPTARDLVVQAQQAEDAVGVEIDAIVTASDVPTGTDSYRSRQWDFAKMRVAAAWPTSTGAAVTVAVIDTGVDAGHPDLAGQVLDGRDVIAGTSGISTDSNGHGTHVAGIIAALTGNGVGISAVAPDAEILPIRVLDAEGAGYMSDAATGVIYAADHGADVINMSLGSTTKLATLSNAIAYARSKGVVVVAAAGNDRAKGSPISYPAADAGVIAVAATDSADQVASYSNAGDYVDVAAPGSAIISTYPTGTGYATMSGTSMAAPHVAAVAALIRAAAPALTPDQVEHALESSATDLGDAGKDTDYGYGRIDATAAVATTRTNDTTSPTTTTRAATTTPATTAPATTTPAPAPATTNPAPAPATTNPATNPATTTIAPTTSVPKATTTPAPMATIPGLLHPVVRVSPARRTVTYGATATIAFTVTSAGKPWALKPAQLCTTATGSVMHCSAVFTSSAGVVRYSRAATGGLKVKLVVTATTTSTAVSSPAAAVVVQSRVTAARTAKGTLTVKLTGAAGQTVQVQRLTAGKWVRAKTFTATATHRLTGLKSGARYRVVVPATTLLLGSTSSAVPM